MKDALAQTVAAVAVFVHEAGPGGLAVVTVLGTVALRVIAVIVRSWLEPAMMTSSKWRILRILGASEHTLSAREIRDSSRGALNRFTLARQLEQLENFGLLQRLLRCGNDGPMYDVFRLSNAGRALLGDADRLDTRGLVEFRKTAGGYEPQAGRSHYP